MDVRSGAVGGKKYRLREGGWLEKMKERRSAMEARQPTCGIYTQASVAQNVKIRGFSQNITRQPRLITSCHFFLFSSISPFLPSLFVRLGPSPSSVIVMAFASAPALPNVRRARFFCAADPPKPPKSSVLTAHLPILPLLVRAARVSWYTFWRVLMAELAPSDKQGRYIRPVSKVSIPPPTEIDRLSRDVLRDFNHTDAPNALYVGLACQWCHRVMLARTLLQLEPDVELRYLQPGLDGLWVLEKPEFGATLLKHIYLQLDSKYQGRFTAPLLIDAASDTILSNESADILQLFANTGRVRIDDHTEVWLRPDPANDVGVDIQLLDDLCTTLYNCINDGVYRCGFATSQIAYEEAQDDLFAALDRVEKLLSASRFLCNPTIITEADVRLFPTVFRFDAVYAILFKACRKSIRADYPAISAWMKDIYNLPGVAETCDLAATQNNYYTSLFPLNPSGIVPVCAPQDLGPVPERRGLGLENPARV